MKESRPLGDLILEHRDHIKKSPVFQALVIPTYMLRRT